MHIYLLPNRKNGLQEILKFGGMTILCRERGYLLGVGESLVLESYRVLTPRKKRCHTAKIGWWFGGGAARPHTTSSKAAQALEANEIEGKCDKDR